MSWGFFCLIVRLIVFIIFIFDLRHRLIFYLINHFLIKYLINRLFFEGGRIFAGNFIQFLLLLELLIVLLDHCLKCWYLWLRALRDLITLDLIWCYIILVVIINRIFIVNTFVDLFWRFLSNATFCYHFFSSVRQDECFSFGNLWHYNRCLLPLCFSNWFI